MNESQIVARMQFFHIVEHRPAPGRKTSTYDVVNNRSGDVLAEVKWYGPWRQYCVFPEHGTVWSKGCIAELQSWMASLR